MREIGKHYLDSAQFFSEIELEHRDALLIYKAKRERKFALRKAPYAVFIAKLMKQIEKTGGLPTTKTALNRIASFRENLVFKNSLPKVAYDLIYSDEGPAQICENTLSEVITLPQQVPPVAPIFGH